MYRERRMEDGLPQAEELAMVAEEQAGVGYEIDISHPWQRLSGSLMRKQVFEGLMRSLRRISNHVWWKASMPKNPIRELEVRPSTEFDEGDSRASRLSPDRERG